MPEITIGRDISSARNVDEALGLADLDWNVEHNDTYFTRGNHEAMMFSQSPKYMSVVRSDTGEEFAHTTRRYQVVQNRDAFKFVDDIIAGGATYWRGGSFRGGRKAFMIVRLPHATSTLSTGELIQRAMIISTSHDSTQGIRANWLPIRFACANVIGAVLANAPMVLRHTASVRDGIAPEVAAEIFYNADEFYTEYQQKAEQLISAPFSDGEMETFIDTLFSTTRVSTGRVRRSNNYLYDTVLENFRNGRETYGSTRWDAYNAVCEYLDYQRPIGNRMDTADNKEESVENERHFNSVLSPNRLGGNRLRTEAMSQLLDADSFGYLSGGE